MSTDNSPQSDLPGLNQLNDDSGSKHPFLSSTWQTIVELVDAYDSEGPEVDLQALEARVLYDASPLIAIAGENIEFCADLDLDDITELCFDEHADDMAIDGGDCEEIKKVQSCDVICLM